MNTVLNIAERISRYLVWIGGIEFRHSKLQDFNAVAWKNWLGKTYSPLFIHTILDVWTAFQNDKIGSTKQIPSNLAR